MTREMAHLQIIGLKPDLITTLRDLRDLGVMHIDDSVSEAETYTPSADVAREREALSTQLMRTNGLIRALSLEDAELPRKAQPVSLAEALEGVAKLRPDVMELTNRRDQLEDERDLLPHFEGTLERLIPLLTEDAPDDALLMGVLVEEGHADRLADLQERLKDIPGASMESSQLEGAIRAALIMVARTDVERVNAIMGDYDLAQMYLPAEVEGDSPQEALRSLNQRVEAVEQAMADNEYQLDRLAENWRDDLLVWRATIEDELHLYEQLEHLGQTEETFVLEGWVPADKVDQVKQAAGEHVFVHEDPVDEDVEPPVEMENPAPVEPFEPLVRLLRLPESGGIDPSAWMAMFLPLFFGLILGDAGYGVVVLGLALYLRHRFKHNDFARDAFTVLAMGGGWAIVWGIIFGEALGTVGHDLGMKPILWERSDTAHVTDLLLLTVGVGLAHVALGLIIGIVQGFREDDRDEIMEAGGKLLGIIGIFAAVASLADMLPAALMTPAIVVAILGVVLLGFGMGSRGFIAPIEVLSTVGNVLSYLRIAAVGLASVFLAVVANEMAGQVGSVIIGVIIAALIHSLNIVLGIFTPSIQSLRLHYVEFFGQFYEGGGHEYKPFRSVFNR